MVNNTFLRLTGNILALQKHEHLPVQAVSL